MRPDLVLIYRFIDGDGSDANPDLLVLAAAWVAFGTELVRSVA